MPDKTKKQRDQFLAFSFASADLFIEVSEEGKVEFVTGAAKGMTGIDETELVGKNWLDLFSAYDQAPLIEIKENAKLAKRCGPILVDMSENIAKRKAVFSAIKMPGTDSFYITLGLSNKMMGKLAAVNQPHDGDLAETSDFLDEAEEVFDFGSSVGIDPDITMFDFGFSETVAEEEFGDENWGKFQDELTDFLQKNSLNGANAGKLSDSKYAITHDPDIDPEFLKQEAQKIAEKYAPDDTEWPPTKAITVQADLESVGEWGAEKAVSYIVTDFKTTEYKDVEKKMSDVPTLSEGIKKLATDNLKKAKELKMIIERVDFSLNFIPTLNVEKNEVAYYEIVPNFNNGDAREWLMLAEDTKQSMAFDLAFCERIVNYISFKAGGLRMGYSFKLSKQSIESEALIEKLNAHLDRGQNLEERLLFEVPSINDLKDINVTHKIIATIKRRNFKLSLNNFTGTVASIKQANTFMAQKVVLNKKIIRNIEKNPRKKASLESLVKRCEKQGLTVVAENIETKEQIEQLKEIGIVYMRGPVFGTPQSSANYMP